MEILSQHASAVSEPSVEVSIPNFALSKREGPRVLQTDRSETERGEEKRRRGSKTDSEDKEMRGRAMEE